MLKRPAGLTAAQRARKRPATANATSPAGLLKKPSSSVGSSASASRVAEHRKTSQEPKVEVCKLLQNLELRDVCINSSESFHDYSILAQVPMAQKLEAIECAKRFEILDRAMGSMCGMGVGDGVGHMFEFLPAQNEPGVSYFDLKNMKFYGVENTFNLELGQWTDDASMGLCMADSLILQKGYDGGDMRARFWCWWNRGYNNAFRLDKKRPSNNSVGLGGNISKSLQAMSRLKKGQKPPPIYEAAGEDAGNGSLMRFTPVAIFFHAASLQDLYKFSRDSSYTTHPGIIAAEACSLLAHLIYRALHRPPGPVDAKGFIEDCTAEYMKTSGLGKKSGRGYDEMKWLVTGKPKHATEGCWAWREELLDVEGTLRARGTQYNGYPVSAGYFGSYSLDGLAMAIWAVYHTTSFDKAIERSVNLLGDADSHGSIAGQLAGALYGYSSIHPQFLKWLNRWDQNEFAVRALLLHDLGSKWAAPDRN